MQSDHGNPVGQWSESSKLRSWFERLEVVFMDLEDENSNDKWKAVKLIKWIGPKGYERLKMKTNLEENSTDYIRDKESTYLAEKCTRSTYNRASIVVPQIL